MTKLPDESHWIKPKKPAFELIDYIHRRNDGYVSIARKDEHGKFENVVALPANRLPGLFAEELQELVDTDGFFSINGMYHYPSLKNKYGLCDDDGNLLTLPARKGSQHLRCLTSCYVDLDCHSRGLSVGQCIGCFIDAQDSRLVPPASVLCRSGRGVWALWLLVDEQGGLQKGFADKERAWSRIQGEITRRLSKLAADEAARDSSRLMRIAGSQNSKSKTRVDYWLQATADGKIPTYTIGELSRFFGLQVPSRVDTSKIPSSFERTRAQKGQQRRWYWDYKALWELLELRGEIPIGMRHNAVYVLGTIMGRLFRDADVLNHQLMQDASRVYLKLERKPSDLFTLKDVLRQLTDAATRKTTSRHIRHDTIATMLRVTPEEAEVLPTLVGRKTSWPCAREFVGSVVSQESPSREAEAKQRRELLARCVDGKAVIPTLRVLQEYLDCHGISASTRTIGKDLMALGYATGRERKPQPPHPELPLE